MRQDRPITREYVPESSAAAMARLCPGRQQQIAIAEVGLSIPLYSRRAALTHFFLVIFHRVGKAKVFHPFRFPHFFGEGRGVRCVLALSGLYFQNRIMRNVNSLKKHTLNLEITSASVRTPRTQSGSALSLVRVFLNCMQATSYSLKNELIYATHLPLPARLTNMKLVPGPLPPIPTTSSMDRLALPLPFSPDSLLWRYPLGFATIGQQPPSSPLLDYKSQLPSTLASDPRVWSRDDVVTFLRWAEREFDLQPIDMDMFQMNGKLQPTPKHIHLLRSCRTRRGNPRKAPPNQLTKGCKGALIPLNTKILAP